MGIGTFGSFTQARMGIYAAQNGLSVTGNNIANINTPGYTRQKLDQTSFYAGGSDRYYSTYDMRIGNGVLCKSVSQLRDPYLDIRYRGEMSSVGAMDAKLAGLENIQPVLAEVGDGDDAFGILGAQFSDFFKQLQQLSDQTGLSEYDIQVRSSAESLVKQFNSYAAQLKEIEKNAETAFGQDVDMINNILTNIRDLSVSIRKADIHGDNALELRDERNLLIDKLSSYMKIDVTYTEEDIGGGTMIEKLTIKLGNANPDTTQETDETVLVDGTYARQLVVKHPKLNGAYDPNAPLGGDNLPYLNKGGKPVATEQEAEWLYNDNYAVELAPLKDSKDRVMVTTKKDGVSTTTLYPGKASETTTDPNTGVVTITTYAKTGKKGPTENPQWDGINPDEQYLAPNGTTPTNLAGAGESDLYIKTVYTKSPSADVALHDNDLYGSLQSQREMLTEKGEFTSKDTILNVDPNAATKRGIPYYRSALNLLANQFAAVFNDANQGFVYNEQGHYVDDNGTELVVKGKPISKDGFTPEQIDYLKNSKYAQTDADGTVTVDMKAYLKAAGGKEKGCPLFSNRGDNNDTDNITAENISISLDWQNGPKVTTSFMEYSNPDVSNTTDSSNVLHMVNLMGQKMDYNPQNVVHDAASDSMFKGDFNAMWVNIGSVLGNDMSSTSTLLDTYYASSVELDTGRNSVSGVDLNDEAMNLMQYSKSYNAACRLMTTIDSVLDKLINGTGMTT